MLRDAYYSVLTIIRWCAAVSFLTPVADQRFSPVHLDVDLYQPTHDALEFFYPRVNQGGIFLIHDYLWAEGVRKAVQEFFAGRPEPIPELAGTYGCIVKL